MRDDHLSIARCCACMAEHDLAEAIGLMGGGLFLLNRELILDLWRQEYELEMALAVEQLKP